MAPKGKSADKGKAAEKGKGKEKDAVAEKGGKQKGAQSINVRHILCEKNGKKEEALARLNAGTKFDEVAREFSEDKARQGEMLLQLNSFKHQSDHNLQVARLVGRPKGVSYQRLRKWLSISSHRLPTSQRGASVRRAKAIMLSW